MYFRLSMRSYSVVKKFFISFFCHCVRNTRAKYFSAVHVDYSCHIHKATEHWDISDVYLPDLIWIRNVKLAQQVWIDIRLWDLAL